MSILTVLVWPYVKRRALEASTYAGLVTAIGGYLHFTVSPNLRDAIDSACVAIVSALLLGIAERKGANPQNSALPPPGTAPVVAPAADSVAAIVVQPTVASQPVVVPKSAVSSHAQPADGTPARRAIRPDFDP